MNGGLGPWVGVWVGVVADTLRVALHFPGLACQCFYPSDSVQIMLSVQLLCHQKKREGKRKDCSRKG